MNNKPEQVIFKATLKDKRITFERNTSHIPTLDHIVNQLYYDIIELRALEKAKQEQGSLIQKASDMTLGKFLKRGRNA